MEKKTEQTLNNHIDFKDIVRLAASINPHARMMNRRRTGFTAKGQRNFATAIKRARFMALMPYINAAAPTGGGAGSGRWRGSRTKCFRPQVCRATPRVLHA